jgi:Zn/Cd-binding protein ZinT
MITEKEIKSLKDFGYEVIEVTGWKNGTHCIEYNGNIADLRRACPAYRPFKDEISAWAGALKFHLKNYDAEMQRLQDEIDKAKSNFHKVMRKNQLIMRKNREAKLAAKLSAKSGVTV